MKKRGGDPEPFRAQIGDVLKRAHQGYVEGHRPSPTSESATTRPPVTSEEPPFEPGRYDFDIAEFPLFNLSRNRPNPWGDGPLVYRDIIRGKDREPVERVWKVYPGAFGFGSQSTQDMLYDLIQLYVEQGCEGTYLHFQTLNRIYRRRHGGVYAGPKDYRRMKRDIDILRGYDFHAENAFWDRETRAYITMHWRLFGAVYYATDRPTAGQMELPFGCIEVSPIFQEVARTRGFFGIGFDTGLYNTLGPLEKRLGIYLAKRFLFEKTHRRFVDDLCQALPLNSSRDRDKRRDLARITNGLIEKSVPFIKKPCSFSQNRDGRWVVEFTRHRKPEQGAMRRPRPVGVKPEVEDLLEDIISAVDGDKDRRWWTKVVNHLGRLGAERALGELRENLHLSSVDHPGKLMTKICIDIGKQRGTPIPRAKRRN